MVSGWLTKNFRASENFPIGQQWKFYFLDALEQAGQLSGERLFGENDWFQEGARALIRTQSLETGANGEALGEPEPTIAFQLRLDVLVSRPGLESSFRRPGVVRRTAPG